ncbi:MAG: hypothetical protein WD066_02745 [Planctomycetaceae bacterium]
MRLPFWLATVVGILPALAGGGEAIADGPWSQPGPETYGAASFDGPPGAPPQFFGSSPYEGFPGTPPPPGSPGVYPTNTPVAVQQGATGLPPGANPWPQISPYDNAFDQHYQKDGLWHRMVSNDFDRTVIVEGLVTRYRRPSGSFVGSTDIDSQIFFGGVAQAQGFSPSSPVNLRTGVFNDIWDETGGVRVRLGHMQPDGSGLEFTGFWGGHYRNSLLFGDPNANFNDIDSLRADNPGLPLDNGTGPDPLFPASSNTNAYYDKNVLIAYSEEAFGGSLTWYTSRAWDLKALKVRPTMGVRYVGIREKFHFRGRGSGGNDFVQFPPGTGPTVGNNTPRNPRAAPDFEGTIDSTVRNHLFGPEIGLRLDLGSDDFKIISESKIAVAGVYEDFDLSGKGLGNGAFDPTYDPLSTFSDSTDHGHVSPVVEQTLSLEANIFGYVPVLKKVELLDRARFRFGYTLTWIGEIQRPDSITYLASPVFPQIKSARTDWYMQNFNAGVSWKY